MPRLEHILCDYMRRSLEGEKPRAPQIGTDLLHSFTELSNARTWHTNGPNAITMPEIEAWCRLMRVPLQPHHVRIVLALDSVWIESFYKKRNAAPEDVKKIPQMSEQPLTAALFDVAVS